MAVFYLFSICCSFLIVTDNYDKFKNIFGKYEGSKTKAISYYSSILGIPFLILLISTILIVLVSIFMIPYWIYKDINKI